MNTLTFEPFISSVKKADTPLDMIVTSGGTRVPIDDVRIIGNISGGGTGAAIATHALEAGHTVRYIANEDTTLPYVGNIGRRFWRGDGVSSSPEYLGKIRAFEEKKRTGQLSLFIATFFQDYVDAVLSSVEPNRGADAIVLSAAVSDFGPSQSASGKLDSKEGVDIHLDPLPKVRDLIRRINQNITIVAFKQMPKETTKRELFQKANASMESGDHDLVVANITDSVNGKFVVQDTWILRRNGTERRVEKRSHLQDILVDEEIPEAVRKRKKGEQKSRKLAETVAYATFCMMFPF